MTIVFRHSSADVVLLANSPVSDLNLEIASKYNINLIPFSLSEFPVAHQAYHPSTLRWTMIYNFFQVITSGSMEAMRL